MASNQCSNCGEVGHFRANCPLPKSECLHHWRVAKALFRRENPDAVQNLRDNQEQNRMWQMEGRTIPFPILEKSISDMLQILYDLDKDLDVLGRPKEWEDANKTLTGLLPAIREMFHNGKGFLQTRELKDVTGDTDIFKLRLEDLFDVRDKLVQKIKSFVNGKLGKLAGVNARNNPIELLRFVYTHHPPKNAFEFNVSKLDNTTLKAFLKKALLHYHPDKQTEFEPEWKCLCEAISRCLTAAFVRYSEASASAFAESEYPELMK